MKLGLASLNVTGCRYKSVITGVKENELYSLKASQITSLLLLMQEMLEKKPSGQERLPMEIKPSVPSALQTVSLPNMV